ncbi:MAG: S-layer homology domain-containing protein [Candidatus Ancillula sp.]|nr:S-layer homology domain-containing protein [Candidatus Ancillula sp.]
MGMDCRIFKGLGKGIKSLAVYISCLAFVVLMSVVLVAIGAKQNKANAGGSMVSFGDYNFGDTITVGGLKWDIVGGHTAGSTSVGMCGSQNANKCADNSAYLMLSNDSASLDAFNVLGSTNGPNYLSSVTGNQFVDYQNSTVRTIISDKFTNWINSNFVGKNDIISRTLFQGEDDTYLGNKCSGMGCSDGNPAKFSGDSWWLPSINEVTAYSSKNVFSQSWLLRSPDANGAWFSHMNTLGDVKPDLAGISSVALRPAFLISLSSLVFEKFPMVSELQSGYCGGVTNSGIPANSNQCVRFGNVLFDVIGTIADGQSSGICSMTRTDGYVDYTYPGETTVQSGNGGNSECPDDSAMLFMSNTSISDPTNYSSLWSGLYFNGGNGADNQSNGCGATTGNATYAQYDGSVLQTCIETADTSQWNLLKNGNLNNDDSEVELKDAIITRSLNETSDVLDNSDTCASSGHNEDITGCPNTVYNETPNQSGAVNQHLFPLSSAEACTLEEAQCENGGGGSDNVLYYATPSPISGQGDTGRDYFLRSPGSTKSIVAYVSGINGYITSSGDSNPGRTARSAMFIKLSTVKDQLLATIDSDSESLQAASGLADGQVTIQNDHKYGVTSGATQDGMSDIDNPTCANSLVSGSTLLASNSLDSYISEESDISLKLIDCGTDGVTISSSPLTLTLPQKIIPPAPEAKPVVIVDSYIDETLKNDAQNDTTEEPFIVGQKYGVEKEYSAQSTVIAACPSQFGASDGNPEIIKSVNPKISDLGINLTNEADYYHFMKCATTDKNINSDWSDQVGPLYREDSSMLEGLVNTDTIPEYNDEFAEIEVTYPLEYVVSNQTLSNSECDTLTNWVQAPYHQIAKISPTSLGTVCVRKMALQDSSQFYSYALAVEIQSGSKNRPNPEPGPTPPVDKCSNGATNPPTCDNNQPSPNPTPSNKICPNLAKNYPDCNDFGIKKATLSSSGSTLTVSWVNTGNFKYIRVEATNNYGGVKNIITTKSSVSFTGLLSEKWFIKIYGINGAKITLIKSLSKVVSLPAKKFTKFKDMKAHGKADKTAVNWLAKYQITTGTKKGIYSPNQVITRIQMALFLYRLAGKPDIANGASCQHNFKDLKGYSKKDKQAVKWLCSTGITTGTSETKYSPKKPVTRIQMALFLSRYAGVVSDAHSKSVKPGLIKDMKFKDIKDLGGKELTAIKWLRSANITVGTDKYHYSPSQLVTRMQMALFMYRMCVTGSTPLAGYVGLGLVR